MKLLHKINNLKIFMIFLTFFLQFTSLIYEADKYLRFETSYVFSLNSPVVYHL